MMYQYLYLYYESVAKPWGSPYKKYCASVKNKAELAVYYEHKNTTGKAEVVLLISYTPGFVRHDSRSVHQRACEGLRPRSTWRTTQ
eukprot:SAG11_NODE_76_length_18005_cov_6.523958_1_plen_85_part_10